MTAVALHRLRLLQSKHRGPNSKTLQCVLMYSQHRGAAGKLSNVLCNQTPALKMIMGSPQAWQATSFGAEHLSALSSASIPEGRPSAKGTDVQRYKQLQEVLRYAEWLDNLQSDPHFSVMQAIISSASVCTGS